MLKKILLFAVICVSPVAGIYAQSTPHVKERDEDDDDSTSVVATIDTSKKIRELQPVEVRAVRASNNSPFAKTELSKADIARQNLGQDLPVLLQNTPSAVINTDAGAGVGYTGIHIRGTDPTRINVTFNGMPVNDPEEQATFFVDIPDIASSTSSIQIQRGVGTSTNGAGAFGATISVSNLQQMDSAGVIYSGSYGSFNTFKNTLVAGTGLLKHGFQFDVRLSKISSDGYIQRSASDLKSMQLTAGWTPNDKLSMHFLFMPGTEKTGQAWNGVPQDSLATNRTYNELGMKSDGTFYNNQTDNYIQNYYQFFTDYKISYRFTIHEGVFLTRGKGYYEEYKTGQAYTDYGLSNVITPKDDTISQTSLIRRLWLDNYYYGGVISAMYAANKTRIAFGGGISRFDNKQYGNIIWAENGGVKDNYQWYSNNSHKTDLNVYAKIEQTVGKFILFGDMQYRGIHYVINGFRNNPDIKRDLTYDFYNPKAGFTCLLHTTAANRQRVYASVAVGNREPNRGAFETDSAHLPKPERLTDYEAGYEITAKKWNASANLYYMDYHNQLVLTGQINDVGAYTQTNVSASYRSGIELQAGFTPADWFRVYGNLTLSQNKIMNSLEYLDSYDDQGNYLGQKEIDHGTKDIAFSPNVISSLTAGFTPLHGKKGSTLSIDISDKYVGKQYLDNTADDARAIKAYEYVNVLVRYSVKTRPFKEIIATLALNNIFGEKYQNNGYTYSYLSGGALSTSNYYYPQAGFNVLGGLTFRW